MYTLIIALLVVFNGFGKQSAMPDNTHIHA